jgi:hypothetical protein
MFEIVSRREPAAGCDARYVTWMVKYKKEDGLFTYGRTSSWQTARACEEKGWTVQPGGKYADVKVRADILAARKEADAEFDGGWEGDCTRGCEFATVRGTFLS